MDAFWGDRSWRNTLYQKPQGLLPGFDLEEKVSNDAVAAAYQERLKKIAGFAYVPDPMPMRNTHGAIVYYLFFASPNQTGAKIVSEIFNKYRDTGGYLMATNSAIEWTESTWNPVTGCTKVSPGCMHCYAERMAKRLQAMGQANYADGFKVAMHEHAVELPLAWKKPRTIFVNSMSDLFHEAIPVEFIRRVFDVMRRADWHQYQLLTKRSKRLLELDSQLPWLPHIWMGVSVENQDYTFRIDHLRANPCPHEVPVA